MQAVVPVRRQALLTMAARLQQAAAARLTEARRLTGTAALRTAALDPFAPLAKGYGMVQTASGALRSVRDVDTGDDVAVRLQDGVLDCQVQKITVETTEN